jgi:tetratricopeptide (TPR) repeat protein
LRDNLYALLATAESEEVAKRIGERLEKLWVESGSDTVTLLLMRAGASLKAKDASLALKFLDAAVDLAPDFAEAWNRRAYVHYELGDLRGAVGDLRRTLALDPNHFKALQGLGSILKETGDDAGALKAYERLIEVHPYAEDAEKAYQELRGKVRGRGI